MLAPRQVRMVRWPSGVTKHSAVEDGLPEVLSCGAEEDAGRKVGTCSIQASTLTAQQEPRSASNCAANVTHYIYCNITVLYITVINYPRQNAFICVADHKQRHHAARCQAAAVRVAGVVPRYHAHEAAAHVGGQRDAGQAADDIGGAATWQPAGRCIGTACRLQKLAKSLEHGKQTLSSSMLIIG